MPNTYSWQFTKLDVYPTYETVTDAVYQINWRMTADDGDGHLATSYGVQTLGPIDPDNFIPYADLTFNDVKDWVEVQIGGEIDTIHSYLDWLISMQVNPPTMSLDPPWI